MLRRLVWIKLKAISAGMSASSNNKKNSKGRMVGYGLLFVVLFAVIAGLFGTIFYQIGGPLAMLKLNWLYFALMGIFSFLLCFVGSIFVTQTQIYESQDNELLLSMPIKPSMILASRMISLLILNYAYELMIALPAAAAYAIRIGFTLRTLSAFILAVLLLPLLATALSCLMGWIIAAVSSKMKRKKLIGMILSVVFFAAYMYVCTQWQMYVQKLIANGEAVASAIERTVPPAYHMGVGIADGNWLSILIFAVWTIIPFAIMWMLLSKSFTKIATAKRGGVKIEYKQKAMKVSGVKKALLTNELRRLGGSNMYMFNAAIGLILMPILAIYLLVKSDALSLYFGILDQGMVAALGCMVLLFMSSLTIISAPTISLEAKTLWILRTLPVNSKDILLSKAMLHIVVSVPFIVVSGVIMSFALKLSLAESVLMIIVPCLFTVFAGISGVLINLKYPKFNWTNEAAAVKQGMAPTLALLLSMAAVIAPVLLYMFIFADMGISADVYMMIIGVLFALLAAISYKILAAKGVVRFEALKGK